MLNGTLIWQTRFLLRTGFIDMWVFRWTFSWTSDNVFFLKLSASRTLSYVLFRNLQGVSNEVLIKSLPFHNRWSVWLQICRKSAKWQKFDLKWKLHWIDRRDKSIRIILTILCFQANKLFLKFCPYVKEKSTMVFKLQEEKRFICLIAIYQSAPKVRRMFMEDVATCNCKGRVLWLSIKQIYVSAKPYTLANPEFGS